MESLFFELIRVSLGIQKVLSRVPAEEEWEKLFELSQKQAVAGICLHGIKELYKDQRYAATLSRKFILGWIGLGSVIIDENQKINKYCTKLINYFSKEGFNCSILKGQGLATFYHNDFADFRLLRQSGDIDLWLGGGHEKVMQHIRTLFDRYDYDYKNVHANFYSDVEVEVHWSPEILMNLFHNRRLQQFWKQHEEDLCSDLVELPDGIGKIHMPSIALNHFYVLLHCYRHEFDEGVGLRQVMDYYFVLRQTKDEAIKIETFRLVKKFGMTKFASALMWVLQDVFHLEKEYLISAPNEKEGRFLLSDIMQSGNFGQFDDRVKPLGKSLRMRKLTTNLQRAPYLIFHYPKEVLWAPIWMAYHFIWKRTWGRDKKKD